MTGALLSLAGIVSAALPAWSNPESGHKLTADHRGGSGTKAFSGAVVDDAAGGAPRQPPSGGAAPATRWLFSVPVDEPIVLPQIEAPDERWEDLLVRSLNGLRVRRALDVFNAADVVPVIDKVHAVDRHVTFSCRFNRIIAAALTRWCR